MSGLPDHIERMRTRIVCDENGPSNANTFAYSGSFASLGIDNSLDLAAFKKNFKVEIISMSESEAVFDLVGIDPPVANALRRILIAEVPTMAIEKVNLYQNTSIIQDEVLCHRIGLIPIRADPRLFTFRQEGEEATDTNSLTFKLHVKCERRPRPSHIPADQELSENEKFINSTAYSSHFEWVPTGNQAEMFAADPPRAVNDDIVVAKLRPGQEIEMEVVCEKGIGKSHAKWSPVATAAYRLLPEIIIKGELRDEAADKLVSRCPMNVFDIEDLAGGHRRATVARPRDCTMCRECIRSEEGEEAPVVLQRVKDHFIFSVESTGALSAKELVLESIKVLREKCLHWLGVLESMEPSTLAAIASSSSSSSSSSTKSK